MSRALRSNSEESVGCAVVPPPLERPLGVAVLSNSSPRTIKSHPGNNKLTARPPAALTILSREIEPCPHPGARLGSCPAGCQVLCHVQPMVSAVARFGAQRVIVGPVGPNCAPVEQSDMKSDLTSVSRPSTGRCGPAATRRNTPRLSRPTRDPFPGSHPAANH